MDIIIFSDNSKIEDTFKGLKKSKDHTISFHPVKSLKKVVGDARPGTLVYQDISKLQLPDIKKAVTYLSKQSEIYFGILDQKGTVKDMADIFHSGAKDYLGKDSFKAGVNARRITSITEMLNRMPVKADLLDEKYMVKENIIISGSDWKKVKTGKEYSFCLMFIELDDQKELKSKGESHLNEFVEEFHNLISEKISKIHGKIWMWMDFGGLILFPFDGKKCDAILTCFKLMMDRKIISVEEFSFDALLSYRIALHIGNTEFKPRGDTGNIVSDSINSIFHLGQKYAEKGNLLLTENVIKFIPEEIKDCFVEEGMFEGRVINRMKELL